MSLAEIAKQLEDRLDALEKAQIPPLPSGVVKDGHPYQVGENYFIRTVTHHYTGRLVAVYPQELILVDAAWIPDDGRFTQAVKDGTFTEVEPFPDNVPVIVPRGAILDACVISFALPRSQK